MSSKFRLGAALTGALIAFANVSALAEEAVVPASIIKQIRQWASSPVVLLTLAENNRKHAGLDEPAIIKLDKQWRAERKMEDQILITEVLSSPLSNYLTAIQARSFGLYTEIFVMDAKGLNAGQSAITSDYWQGDEAKWQKTFPVGADAVFIDKPEIGDNGTENVQVNLAIADGKTVAGAITVEVNLTEMKRRQLAGKL